MVNSDTKVVAIQSTELSRTSAVVNMRITENKITICQRSRVREKCPARNRPTICEPPSRSIEPLRSLLVSLFAPMDSARVDVSNALLGKVWRRNGRPRSCFALLLVVDINIA